MALATVAQGEQSIHAGVREPRVPNSARLHQMKNTGDHSRRHVRANLVATIESFFDYKRARPQARDASGSLRGVPSRLIATVRNARKGRCQPRSNSPATQRRRLRPRPLRPICNPRSPSSRASRRMRRLPRPALGHGGLSSPTRQFLPSTIRIIPTRPSGATPHCNSLERPPPSPISSIRSRTGLRRRKTPGAQLWRCGRQKSRLRSRSRQDRLPISPSISSRFPVLPTLRPAHTSPFPTARLRSSVATSRAFPGPAPSSRSISTTTSPTPRATLNRSATLSQTATISISL